MYNRYIPQADGSFQKNCMPDHAAPVFSSGDKHSSSCANPHPDPVHGSQASCHPLTENPGSFLKHLIPANFDTGDLLVVLLLLLIAGDSKDKRNTSLLTLALYFLL